MHTVPVIETDVLNKMIGTFNSGEYIKDIIKEGWIEISNVEMNGEDFYFDIDNIDDKDIYIGIDGYPIGGGKALTSLMYLGKNTIDGIHFTKIRVFLQLKLNNDNFKRIYGALND